MRQSEEVQRDPGGLRLRQVDSDRWTDKTKTQMLNAGMKLLLPLVGLLAVFLHRSTDCRPVDSSPRHPLVLPVDSSPRHPLVLPVDSSPRHPLLLPVDSSPRHPLVLPRPVLLQMGEQFSVQLGGGGGKSSSAVPDLTSSSSSSSSSSLSMAVDQALLQLTQRPLQAPGGGEEEEEKGKRSEEPPISLDLTFHLLREVLEMARAEQLAQQAHDNRRIMESFGK